MFSRFLISALSIVMFTPEVLAAEPPLGCYVNSYDKAHLRKHKGQSVTSMAIKNVDTRKLENAGSVFHAEITVTLRGKDKAKWSEVALCNGKPGDWTCQIECDGGGFKLSEDANGLTLFNSEGFRISKDGGCGEENDAVQETPGNRMYRLKNAKLSACK